MYISYYVLAWKALQENCIATTRDWLIKPACQVKCVKRLNSILIQIYRYFDKYQPYRWGSQAMLDSAIDHTGLFIKEIVLTFVGCEALVSGVGRNFFKCLWRFSIGFNLVHHKISRINSRELLAVQQLQGCHNSSKALEWLFRGCWSLVMLTHTLKSKSIILIMGQRLLFMLH